MGSILKEIMQLFGPAIAAVIVNAGHHFVDRIGEEIAKSGDSDMTDASALKGPSSDANG